ncbi:MAG: TIGR02186 family protein [Acidithiobacillus sp.]
MKCRGYLLIPLLLASVVPASAGPLVVATNVDRVSVTSHFTGRNVLVYGAISHPGQVIVLLRSPDTTEAMTQKSKTGPIWLIRAKVTVTGTPGIWQMLSSAPVAQILPPATRQKLGLEPADVAKLGHYLPQPQDPELWQQAFLRNKFRRQDYVIHSEGVHVWHHQLFSAVIKLPADLPLGRYQLNTYLIHDQQVVADQKQTINVRQVGFQGWIAHFAKQDSWVYGVVLTLLLAGLGLGLGIVMRRRSA